MPLKILLADDHLVLLAGMRALLEREGYQVVADVSDGRQAVNLARRLQPHIAVLDITMPGLNGLAAAQKIRRLCPETKVIILTMHKETPYVIEALDAEVMGYVLKTQAAQDLLAAINSVAANNVYLSQGISDVVVDAYRNKNGPDGHRLTLREREVLQLIAEGHRTRASGRPPEHQRQDGGVPPRPDHAKARHSRHGRPRALCHKERSEHAVTAPRKAPPSRAPAGRERQVTFRGISVVSSQRLRVFTR